MNTSLFDKINYDKAYRENRYGAAMWVLEHPETLQELLEYCFKNDKEISHKANWALEFVCLEKLALLVPYFDYFFENMSKVKSHQSVRALSHICEIVCIEYYKKNNPLLIDSFTENHKNIIVECSFDWLITDQKIACQARAMLCLYYLGRENDWIHPELRQILERNIPGGSAGYKARGKKILSRI